MSTPSCPSDFLVHVPAFGIFLLTWLWQGRRLQREGSVRARPGGA